MNKMHFYSDLHTLLSKIVNWLRTNKSEPGFDLDTEWLNITQKNNLADENNFPSLLYSYLDILCDAKEHNFKLVNKDYTYMQAIADLEFICNLIESNEISALENDLVLQKRLLQAAK